MKKIFIAFLLLGWFQHADAQSDSTPIYKRYPVVPVFTIMKAPDSTKFTKEDLKKKTPTLIMLFSPDCSHCQVSTKEMLAHIDKFKGMQIIMVSSLDFSHIKTFYEEYKLADYPNITVGRDGSYFLGTFYKIHNYPSMFLYNKKGKFVESFQGEFKMESIPEAL